MSLRQVIARQTGTLAGALIIEGLPYMFTTSDARWALYNRTAGANFPQQLSGALQLDGLEWAFEVDFKHGDLRMPGMTFTLQDVDFAPGTTPLVPLRLSWLMAGPQAATRSQVVATIGTGDTEITLTPSTIGEWDDINTWGATGYAYCDGEAFRYTGRDVGAGQLTGVVHAVFFSEAVEHVYNPPDLAARVGELGTLPEITDRPIHWTGRRAFFLVGEVLPDGAIGLATVVWAGVVRGDMRPDGSGLRWTVPCESRWEILNTEILAEPPTANLSGFILDAPNAETPIRWYDADGLGPAGSGDFVLNNVNGVYITAEDVLADLTASLNASLAAGGVTDVFRFSIQDGHVTWEQIIPQVGAGASTISLALRSEHSVLVKAFFDGHYRVDMPHVARDVYVGALAPRYAYSVANTGSRIYVDSTSGFVAINQNDQENAAGERWQAQSVVKIGEQIVDLIDVDVGTSSLLLGGLAFGIFDRQDPEAVDVIFGTAATLPVTEGLRFGGSLWACWRDAFVDNASVPVAWKGGLRTSDFDWTNVIGQIAGMNLYLNGGVLDARWRMIVAPTNFRKLFLEDLAFSGLVPAIGPNATISARLAAAPNLVSSVGSINDYLTRAGEPVEYTPLLESVVNRFEVQISSGLTRVEDVTVSVPLPTSRQAYGQAAKRSLSVSGVDGTIEQLTERVVELATRFYQWFGRPNAIAVVPCTIRAAGLLPCDTIELTHWMLPNPDTGERGVTGVVARVTRVAISPWKNKVDVTVQWKMTGRQGGIAPAALITAYADLGAGTEPQRYRLTFTPGTYVDHSPPSLVGSESVYETDDEGAWFSTLPSAKVELRELDNDTAPLRESLTLSLLPFNGATGIFLTAAPSGAAIALIGGGARVVLTLDDYDTAAQIALAQEYTHVCDEDDFLIKDIALGFRPG